MGRKFNYENDGTYKNTYGTHKGTQVVFDNTLYSSLVDMCEHQKMKYGTYHSRIGKYAKENGTRNIPETALFDIFGLPVNHHECSHKRGSAMNTEHFEILFEKSKHDDYMNDALVFIKLAEQMVALAKEENEREKISRENAIRVHDALSKDVGVVTRKICDKTAKIDLTGFSVGEVLSRTDEFAQLVGEDIVNDLSKKIGISNVKICPVKDHRGQWFASEEEMCKIYDVDFSTYKARINKNHSVKKALGF